jgi:DNA polymerase delta subunit 1
MKRTTAESEGAAKKQQRAYEDGFDEEEDLGLMDGIVFEKIDGPEDSVENEESKWSRPPMKTGYDPKNDALEFHWLDIDSVSGDPLKENPAGGSIAGAAEGPVPIIRLYGVTQEGQSVMAHVHGFTPYFYVSFGASTELTESLLGQLLVNLDQRVS